MAGSLSTRGTKIKVSQPGCQSAFRSTRQEQLPLPDVKMLAGFNWPVMGLFSHTNVAKILYMDWKSHPQLILICSWCFHVEFCGLPLCLSWYRIHLQCGRPGFHPWAGKIPWRRERLPAPVLCPGEFHGPYSPWGHKESDTTE